MIADEASVADNLFTGVDGLWTRSMPTSEKIARAQTLMRELADEDIDVLMPAGELPLSIKAWITIGRALLTEPKVLILDESSAALDFDSTERLFNKMRELRDKGAAILIVTHRIAELIRISDRATVMRDGKDVGVLTKSEITEENLLSLMTGRAESGKAKAEAANKTTSHEVTLRTRQVKVWDEGEPVDFGLLKGEIVGITGLDGHGQDNFVRILAGVEQARQGYPEIKTLDDEYVTLKSLDEAKAQGISFVSGDRKREGILPNLSIFENLLIPLYRTNTHVPGSPIHQLDGFVGYIRLGSRTPVDKNRHKIKFDHFAQWWQSTKSRYWAIICITPENPGAKRPGTRHRCRYQAGSLQAFA